MRVRLRTILAGPSGTHRPGAIVDLPDDAARYLVESGKAAAVDAVERATAEPSVERAVVRRKPRGRKRA